MFVLNMRRFLLGIALVGVSNCFAQSSSVVDKATSAPVQQGANREWLPSKTNDGAWDRVPHRSIPIAWNPIREADILWKKRIWREIDSREKANVGFRYNGLDGDESTGGGMFIEILIDGLKRGLFRAYADDRFTTDLSKDQIIKMVSGRDDTTKVYDPTTDTYMPKVSHTDFNPEVFTKFRLKEDWIFDRNEGKMVVRIVGLAPMEDIYGEDGGYRATRAAFWLYYPDLREYLAKFEVFNPKNDIVRYTWEEFFESRVFASRIIKESNPFQTSLDNQGVYPNKFESLYEGQRISENIFNKEHDMWVY
jgi:gliding motility associated protien GldN